MARRRRRKFWLKQNSKRGPRRRSQAAPISTHSRTSTVQTQVRRCTAGCNSGAEAVHSTQQEHRQTNQSAWWRVVFTFTCAVRVRVLFVQAPTARIRTPTRTWSRMDVSFPRITRNNQPMLQKMRELPKKCESSKHHSSSRTLSRGACSGAIRLRAESPSSIWLLKCVRTQRAARRATAS